jgi:TPR repeat protein
MMATVFNNWVFALGFAVLICFGSEQSKAQVEDMKQMRFAELQAAADKGNPQAQFELGERFHNGDGVLKSSTEAAEWWQKAAAQKFPPAEFDLGMAYGSGDGVPKNMQEGIKWCRMAGDSGLVMAQMALGILYCDGRSGVEQDYTEAFKWFTKAAEQGNLHAEYYLAVCYQDGKGTPTNSSEAISWLQRAGINGVANAQVDMGKYCFDAGFAELGIPTQIKPDTSMTRGQLTNQNFARGIEWYQQAANQNYPPAQMFLTFAYQNGTGVDKDPIEAYKWFVLAIRGPHPETWKIDATNFTTEQISAGELRAEEFSETNHITPKSVQEIPGL